MFLPSPVTNLASVNEIYSGMNALNNSPTELTSRAIKDVRLRPSTSDRAPNT